MLSTLKSACRYTGMDTFQCSVGLPAWTQRFLSINTSSREDHIFRERFNLVDEEDLLKACDRVNRTVASSTFSIVAAWSKSRKMQVSSPLIKGESSSSQSPDRSLKQDVSEAIGDELEKRLQYSLPPLSISSIASVLEFALRAWAIRCIEIRISNSLLVPNGSKNEHFIEDLIEEIKRKEGAMVARRWADLRSQASSQSKASLDTDIPDLPIDAGTSEPDILQKLFGRLIDLCSHNQGANLAEVLVWRALAYQNICEDVEREAEKIFLGDLLDGMKAIFLFIGEELDSTFISEFPGNTEVGRLSEPVRELSDIIHVGFVTGVYEVHSVRPGDTYDDSRIDVRNSKDRDPQRRPDQVACTLELGLRKMLIRCVELEPEEHGLGTPGDKWHVLLNPVVLL